MLCYDCDKPICRSCFTAEHNQHAVIDVETAAAMFRRVLEDSASRLAIDADVLAGRKVAVAAAKREFLNDTADATVQINAR